MTSKQKQQIKKTAVRWLALLLAVLLVGGAIFSSVIGLIHAH